MKILFVKLGSIGDIAHALPALAAVRRALPDAEISWVAETRAAEILRGNRLLSRLIEIDTRGLRQKSLGLKEKLEAARAQFAELRRESYDVALDFQGLHKSALVARLAGAPRRVGFDKTVLREPTSRFLLTETVEIPKRIHVIEKNLRLAEIGLQIEIPRDESRFEFPIFAEEKHRREALETIERVGANFAILNPGGGWATKLWDARRFGALADEIWQKFNFRSIVTFGPGEENLANAVVENSRLKRAFAAQLSLKGFYELARQARVYVGGDTGPTHLAIAAGTPVVGLFGPTEWWRNGSPRAADICVERADINCRTDCHRRACSNWICLDIETSAVLRAVEKRLELKRITALV